MSVADDRWYFNPFPPVGSNLPDEQGYRVLNDASSLPVSS